MARRGWARGYGMISVIGAIDVCAIIADARVLLWKNSAQEALLDALSDLESTGRAVARTQSRSSANTDSSGRCDNLARRWHYSGMAVVAQPHWVNRHLGGASASTQPICTILRSRAPVEEFHERRTRSRRLLRELYRIETLANMACRELRGRVGSATTRTQRNLLLGLLRQSETAL